MYAYIFDIVVSLYIILICCYVIFIVVNFLNIFFVGKSGFTT